MMMMKVRGREESRRSELGPITDFYQLSLPPLFVFDPTESARQGMSGMEGPGMWMRRPCSLSYEIRPMPPASNEAPSPAGPIPLPAAVAVQGGACRVRPCRPCPDWDPSAICGGESPSHFGPFLGTGRLAGWARAWAQWAVQ